MYDVFEQEELTVHRFSFLRCPACTAPMVAEEERFIDEDEVYGWSRPVRVLPEDESASLGRLPPSIYSSFRDAKRCLRVKAFAASAMMCRKSLEAMCHEHGVKRGTLAKRLKQLKSDGYIEDRLYEWAEALRIVGNEAAHEISTDISPEDARDILEFTNALLQYVFTFREKFDDFMARRHPA